MALFNKESRVKLVSYQYTVDVEKKQASFIVTLQNTSGDVVTQKVRLRYKIRSHVSFIESGEDKMVSLDPFETKTFEYTMGITFSFGGNMDEKWIKKGKNSYWVELGK